jgi:hypothetical protein
MPLRYPPRGAGGPIAAKRKKANSQKSKLHNCKIEKTQNLESVHHKFFHEIDREIVLRKIVLLFARSAVKTFASSPLSSIRNVRGACFMRGSSVPMKRRHLPG